MLRRCSNNHVCRHKKFYFLQNSLVGYDRPAIKQRSNNSTTLEKQSNMLYTRNSSRHNYLSFVAFVCFLLSFFRLLNYSPLTFYLLILIQAGIITQVPLTEKAAHKWAETWVVAPLEGIMSWWQSICSTSVRIGGVSWVDGGASFLEMRCIGLYTVNSGIYESHWGNGCAFWETVDFGCNKQSWL